ncbi:MAG: Hsp20/alpha crystallin family protein [Desulforhopalus sp.]
MNLVHYNPHRGLSRRANRSDRFFDEIFDDFFTPFFSTGSSVQKSQNSGLKVDIYQKDNAVIIDAELPGVEKDDIYVDVKGKNVTLGGERKSDTELKEEDSYRRERVYGKFERTFSLPFEVDTEAVKASFNNGILKLEIAKPEEQVVKKIAIN